MTFKKFVSLFYRLHYYSQKAKSEPYHVATLKRQWALDLLDLLQVKVESRGPRPTFLPALFVGNHISYLDIPLLLSLTDVSFVAKQEVARWPFFGKGSELLDTVYVKREKSSSRTNARSSIAHAILNKSQKIVVFPSGTTCINESKPWRWGSFEMAHEHRIPVQPFRLNYEPLRETAYIDADFFPLHLWKLMHAKTIQVNIEFHPLVQIQDPKKDAAYFQAWTQAGLNSVKFIEPRRIDNDLTSF